MTVRYLDLEDDSRYTLYRLLHCSIHGEIENVANEGEESQYLLLILLLNFGLLELDLILLEHSRFDKELMMMIQMGLPTSVFLVWAFGSHQLS